MRLRRLLHLPAHILPLLLIVILLAIAAPSMAQEAVRLNTLTISLWPEFDDPRLLVLIDGALDATGQTVRIPVPAGAEINAIAVSDASGNLLDANADVQPTSGGGSIVTLTTDKPRFRIEYYVSLATNGDQRVVDFKLPAGFITTAAGNIEVLLPPDSRAINATPELQNAGATATSAIILERQLGAIGADQDIAQKVSYNNATGALTSTESSTLQPTPARQPTPTPVTTSAPRSSSTPLLIGLAAGAVALIGLGIWGLLRTRRTEPKTETQLPSTANKDHQPAQTQSDSQDRFCRQCGAAFVGDDRFCRQCGAPRR